MSLKTEDQGCKIMGRYETGNRSRLFYFFADDEPAMQQVNTRASFGLLYLVNNADFAHRPAGLFVTMRQRGAFFGRPLKRRACAAYGVRRTNEGFCIQFSSLLLRHDALTAFCHGTDHVAFRGGLQITTRDQYLPTGDICDLQVWMCSCGKL